MSKKDLSRRRFARRSVNLSNAITMLTEAAKITKR